MNIIDSFWIYKHGKQYLVFLRRSRYLYLRKVRAKRATRKEARMLDFLTNLFSELERMAL
jgi:hypothetical protein